MVKKEYIHVCVTGSPCCTVGKKNHIGEKTKYKKLILIKKIEKAPTTAGIGRIWWHDRKKSILGRLC